LIEDVLPVEHVEHRVARAGLVIAGREVDPDAPPPRKLGTEMVVTSPVMVDGEMSAHDPTVRSKVVDSSTSKVRFWISSPRAPFSTVARLPRVSLN
jgi:hypothetical protein